MQGEVADRRGLVGMWKSRLAACVCEYYIFALSHFYDRQEAKNISFQKKKFRVDKFE